MRNASATDADSDTAKPCNLRIALIARRAERSSSTIRTDTPQAQLEAAPRWSGLGKADGPAEVACELLADGQTHSESLAAVSFMIVHLVKLVEQERDVFRWDADASVADANLELRVDLRFAHVGREQLEGDAAGVRVLDRVVDQVRDDPLEL